METLDPEIRELAEGLVTNALSKGTIDFMGAIGNVVPITMISRLIGFRGSNLDELWRSAVHMTKLVGSTLTRTNVVGLARRSPDPLEAEIVGNSSVRNEGRFSRLVAGGYQGIFHEISADRGGARCSPKGARGLNHACRHPRIQNLS